MDGRDGEYRHRHKRACIDSFVRYMTLPGHSYITYHVARLCTMGNTRPNTYEHVAARSVDMYDMDDGNAHAKQLNGPVGSVCWFSVLAKRPKVFFFKVETPDMAVAQPVQMHLTECWQGVSAVPVQINASFMLCPYRQSDLVQ
jgi:hypothetical protein